MNDRRHHPRHPIQFSLMVSLPEAPENYFPAEATTLSLASLEIHCHVDLVTALLRQQQLPLMCNVTFQLPGAEPVYRIIAQVLTHRRMSQYQYALVLLFRHEDAEQESELEQSIDSLMEAAKT